MIYSTDHSRAVVLLFVALWFVLRGDLFYVLPCVVLFLCFGVLFGTAIASLGEGGLVLVLFVCLFYLCLFGFCRLPLPLGVWQGLQFVIVALLLPFFEHINNVKQFS